MATSKKKTTKKKVAKKATKKVAKKAAKKIVSKKPQDGSRAINQIAKPTQKERAISRLNKKIEDFCKKNNVTIVGAINMPDHEVFGRAIFNEPKSALELIALKKIAEEGI